MNELIKKEGETYYKTAVGCSAAVDDCSWNFGCDFIVDVCSLQR